MSKRLRILVAVILGISAAGAVVADPVVPEGAARANAPPARTAGGVTPAALIAPVAPRAPKPASPAPTPALTPGQILYNGAHDAAADPLSWSVLIHKSHHELIVYYQSRLYANYSAVFGRNLDRGAKAYANDRRTPEGVYTITKKSPSRRFDWFLKLNYPNSTDRRRYRELRASRIVPVTGGGRPPGIGGSIGIHGTDVPVLNQGLVDWTTGCISVSNAAVAELARLLPVGTVVIIKP